MKMNHPISSNRNLLLQILLLGGIWVLIPLLDEEFSLSQREMIRATRSFVGVAIIIIINVKFLLPKLYFRKKTTLYFISSLAVLIFVMISVHYLTFLYFRPPTNNSFQYMRVLHRPLPYVLALFGSTLFAISTYANRQAQETLRLQREKLDTEVKFLKSQINPHFLFNTLNNLYSLSHLKPEKTPENILKLSEILRYMLYECNAAQVPLYKEIAYLENYVALKLLKDSRGLNIKMELDKSHPDLQIAPLLLVPFVENAFKHSKIENLAQGWITIKLSTGVNKLIFQVENSIPSQVETKDEVGGIGLQNVQRQLALLYPNHHDLQIKNEGGIFHVYLEINTSNSTAISQLKNLNS